MPKSMFLSVLKPPITSGNLVLNFVNNEDITQASNFTSTTALLSTDTPSQCGRKIFFQLQTDFALNNASYNGTPVFNSDTFPFTFRNLRAFHINSIWSQCDWDLEIGSYPSGSVMSVDPSPIFPTLQDAHDLAPGSGVKFDSASGERLTEPQIIMAIRAASSKIVQLLNGFNVIPATYFQEASGNWQRGITTHYAPVIKLDNIVAKGPYLPQYVFSLGSSIIQRVEIDPFTGSIQFLDWSNAVGLREAADFGNALILTYTAGHEYVLPGLSQVAMQLLSLNKTSLEVESFKGASFAMTFKDPMIVVKLINGFLAPFAV